MLRKSGDCFHYLFYLIRGVLLLGMLGACQSPLQETPRPTLPPQPTITATPVPLTSTAIPPTPEATPASRVIAPQSAAEVVELVKLDEGTITGAPLYSPDGQLLAIPTSTGIDLYDARTLQEVRSIPALSVGRTSLVADWPRFIAFSPDGQLLAAGMRTAVFSPDGRLLADEMGQAVFLWSVSDGTLVRQIPASPETTFLDLGISPGGEILAAGFSDGTVHLWHAATGEELNTLPGFELEFSPDGSMLVTMPFGLEGDNHIYLYDPASGTLSGQWDGQRAGFLPAGQLWVENNGALRIIDTDAGRTLHAFSGSRATF